MFKDYVESNIVLLGSFDPAKFDKLFFVKSSFIEESDFETACIFTPDFVRINSKNMVINVTRQQIVIINRNNSVNISELARVINDAETKIDAMGFNFKWFVFVEEKINEHTRARFGSSNASAIADFFNSKDAVYGYYVSKDYRNSRMKLDIKPINLRNINDKNNKEALSFDFNFHFENKENVISDSLDNHSDYQNEVINLMNKYE